MESVDNDTNEEWKAERDGEGAVEKLTGSRGFFP